MAGSGGNTKPGSGGGGTAVASDIPEASRRFIDEWTRRLERNIPNPTHSSVDESLSAHLASQALGRDFGESMETYLKRRGLQEFRDWAVDTLRKRGVLQFKRQ